MEQPTHYFEDLGLCDSLLDGLDAMGFQSPTPIQAQVIPLILDGRDLIACAQTGTGKTAAYLLPVLDKISRQEIPHTSALVIAPTRELALQIDQALQGFSYFTHASSIPIYGGNDGMSFDREKRALTDGASIIHPVILSGGSGTRLWPLSRAMFRFAGCSGRHRSRSR